jgi:transcriptional regulator
MAMYIPGSFREADDEPAFAVIEQFSFATLISQGPSNLQISHLPLWLDRSQRRLTGHVALANPHTELLRQAAPTTAIFHGPHAYISPQWYLTRPAVPTWNYVVVHVHGLPRAATTDETAAMLVHLVDKYESLLPTPWDGSLPTDDRARLLAAIMGFVMSIDVIEAKFKLGQNRSMADQQQVRMQLQSGTAPSQQLAAFMRLAE